jgi:basic membrane protein A
MNGRKILAIALVLVLMAAVLAGCSGNKGQQQQNQQGQQPSGEEKLKVGLVFDVGGRGDLSFNDSAYAGLERAAKDFADKIEVEYREPSAGGQDREQLLRLLAENGFDLIFGVGFLFTEHIQKVAQEFPDVKFALIDGAIDGLDENSNVACLLFKEHEGSFLVGAAAAMKSKTGKIGFVGGMKSPLIERFEVGYMAGAKYVNPNIEIYSDYIGTTGDAFKDPVKGKELALNQFKKGADVVYHASGASGVGVIEAAAAEKKFAIGVDSDQSLSATEEQRPYILTSMLKRVDVAVYETIKSMVEGNFKGGYKVFGLAEDGVGYAENDYNKELIADIKPKLEEIKEKIVKGEIKVPVDKTEYNEFLKSNFK